MDRENNYSPLKGLIALGIISALTGLLIYSIHLTTIKWPAEQARNQHAYEQAASSPENLLLVCPPSHDGKPIPPEQCKRSGQYEHDRRQQMSDHRAQISMKHAAWWTVGFTFLGLILIGYTLVQTSRAAGLAVEVLKEAKKTTTLARESLREAEKSTVAANKSVEVTRSMGVAQARAYVHADSIQFEDSEVPKFNLKVTNTGITPAHWFEVSAITKNYTSLESLDEAIKFDEMGEFTRWNALSGNKSLKCPIPCREQSKKIRLAQEDGRAVVVYGVIRYLTIFDEIYETQFAFVSTKPKRKAFLSRPPATIETYKRIGNKR